MTSEQPVYALDGVSTSVKRGEFVAVLGANGCGKSTLAKHFNAILLPESRHSVYVEGMDTSRRQQASTTSARRWAWCSRTRITRSWPPWWKRMWPLRWRIWACRRTRCAAEWMTSMKMAGIYEFRERAPHNLSGGQKQRVAIAGVVAMRPDCLILDEATAMLDPRGREQVMQTIHHLNKNMGITVVSITHYMEEAAQADRVLVMSKGHVVMEGTPKEVFSQTEKVRSLHLDVPQAAELRDELVKAGIPTCRRASSTPASAHRRCTSCCSEEGTDEMADIIKVEHLSYVYNPGMPNAVTALDDVSFTVEEGDFVGIIGATGSGKSTLITHMNGLNKPTSGKIYIDGRDLWADPEKIRDFRFLTGLVFQYPEYQLFEETCYKDIAFGPKNMGLDEAEIDQPRARGRRLCGSGPGHCWSAAPLSCPAARSAGWPWQASWPCGPASWCWTSPPPAWTRRAGTTSCSEVKEYHKKTGTTVPAGVPQHGGHCQVRQPGAGDDQQEDRHVRYGGERVCPGSGAAGAGPERAPGDKNFPQAAGDGGGRPGGRVHHPLCGQDHSGRQGAGGTPARVSCIAPGC